MESLNKTRSSQSRQVPVCPGREDFRFLPPQAGPRAPALVQDLGSGKPRRCQGAQVMGKHELGASVLGALSVPSTVHHFIFTFADPQDGYFHAVFQMRTPKLREVKVTSSVLIFFFSSFYIY